MNYEPDYRFPGTGESGLTGITGEPETGDLFLSMICMEDSYAKTEVVQPTNADGLKMDSIRTIITGIPSVIVAYQVQAVITGQVAQDDADLRGTHGDRLHGGGTVPLRRKKTVKPKLAPDG